MLLPAACLFLRRYKSRTDDKQPMSVSVDSVYLDTLQIVIAHTIYSRVTTPDRKITPVEYELWFLSINSHLARWYKSPSRRAVSSHSTLTPGIFAYLSDGCLWVTRYSLPSRCASRTLDLLRYFSWILEISPLRENKFSLSGIIPKSLFCSLMRHWPANVRLNVIGKIRTRRPAPSWKTWSKISHWLPVR